MLISELKAFTPDGWRTAAEGFEMAATALTSASGITTRVSATVEMHWEDPAARQASALFRSFSRRATGRASQCTSASQIVSEAATNLLVDKITLLAVLATIDPATFSVSDAGVVNVLPRVAASSPTQSTALSRQASAHGTRVRAVLTLAQTHLDAAAAGLAELDDAHIPTPEAGILDLDDTSIRRAVATSQQGDYHDSMTIAVLMGKGEADPQWVRDHIRYEGPYGWYVVTMYDDNGQPVEVQVDTAPHDAPSTREHGSGTRTATTGAATWITIMEEAYRLHFDDMIDGRHSSDVPIETVVLRVTGQQVTPTPAVVPDVLAAREASPTSAVIVTPSQGYHPPERVHDSDRTGWYSDEYGYSKPLAHVVTGSDAEGRLILRSTTGPLGEHEGQRIPPELHVDQGDIPQVSYDVTVVP